MSEVATKKDLQALEGRLENSIEKKFDTFTLKLFRYLDKRFSTIEEEIADLHQKFFDLQSAVDGYRKEVERFQQESIARDAKVDRLERWICKSPKKQAPN